jgi:arylsulfatase
MTVRSRLSLTADTLAAATLSLTALPSDPPTTSRWANSKNTTGPFNGAVSTRMPITLPGRHAGYDNGRVLSLIAVPLIEFDKSNVDFLNIKGFPRGAWNDTIQNP